MRNYVHAYFTSLKKSIAGWGGGLAAGALLGLAAGGCGLTPQDQTLGTQTFTYTIPALTLPGGIPLPPGVMLPSIKCAVVSDCASMLSSLPLNSIPGLSLVCDTGYCAADLKLTILYVIDASSDPAFTLGIAQSEADSMRDVKMTYGITSSVTLAINSIDVYAGSDGLRGPADPRSNYLGTVGPVPAMGSVPYSADQYLLIEDGTPPHTQFINYAKHPENKFDVLMVATTPRLKAGDPLPAGKIDIKMVPIVHLLNR
jgi:hypothetical protein